MKQYDIAQVCQRISGLLFKETDTYSGGTYMLIAGEWAAKITIDRARESIELLITYGHNQSGKLAFEVYRRPL